MYNCNESLQPLVSIIVRTCSRPNVLRLALESIQKQTYPNIEVIVVEDGSNDSEKMLREEYGNLPIKYFYMKEKAGRTKTGNFALAQASGKYLNFLDDDDMLYPNHVEVLVQALEGSTCYAAYSIAEESQIVVKSKDPYEARERRKLIRYTQPFNRILLYHYNYIPIQSILFARELYEHLGGFDEELDVLEDWDLWVRYSTRTDFIYIDKVTSVYHVPFVKKKKMERNISLYSAQKAIQQKFEEYDLKMNIGQIYRDMDYVVKKYKTGKCKRYIRLIIDFLMYGER